MGQNIKKIADSLISNFEKIKSAEKKIVTFIETYLTDADKHHPEIMHHLHFLEDILYQKKKITKDYLLQSLKFFPHEESLKKILNEYNYIIDDVTIRESTIYSVAKEIAVTYGNN